VDVFAGQTPFLILHLKLFIPTAALFTKLFGELGLVMFKKPDSKLQVPTPGKGMFPASIAPGELTQIV
jgi:hypothetical protein